MINAQQTAAEHDKSNVQHLLPINFERFEHMHVRTLYLS